MKITVHATPENHKNILDLLEEQGVSLPCNCHGANTCGGKQYDFPCTMIPHEDTTVTIRSQKKLQGISMETPPSPHYVPDTLLIDLGTTTVAMVFYNSEHQSVFHSEVFPNPQISVGADVVSRIKYDVEFHDNHALKTLICNEISKKYEAFLSTHEHIHIDTCLIGGNTTMIHLLLGLSLEGMTSAPFTPSPATHKTFCTKYNDTDIIIFPWLSAFIGGDILSGILYLNFDGRADTCLLADLGTNGELALLHGRQIYIAGTAAGSAFEGGGLENGCPAIPGAISDVTLGKIMPKLQTIGNKLPTGICGSGAISILSQLLSCGYLDSSGILTSKFPEEGLLISKNPTDNIRFTANDIRQIQLSIAAIGAGIDTLCHEAGIDTSMIDHLYLAGGLGYNINIPKAALTGLFSGVKISKVTSIGNSCLHGLASVCDVPSSFWKRAELIQHTSKEIILADNAFFQKKFIHHMTY